MDLADRPMHVCRGHGWGTLGHGEGLCEAGLLAWGVEVLRAEF